jgi:hypothetical protein
MVRKTIINIRFTNGVNPIGGIRKTYCVQREGSVELFGPRREEVFVLPPSLIRDSSWSMLVRHLLVAEVAKFSAGNISDTLNIIKHTTRGSKDFESVMVYPIKER